MMDLFSVDCVFVTILGYPMSYLEFSGTCFYLWSVWLVTQRRMLTWPVGIVGVLLFMTLFYQIRLYSDTVEQIYYLAASFYGWWYWSQDRPKVRREICVSFSSVGTMIFWGGITALLSAFLGWSMGKAHLWVPTAIEAPASYPYIDALTTVMSFTAMLLMARRRIESWIYWIVVDVIGIWLYFIKDVRFISLLYCLLLVLAVKGFIMWFKDRGGNEHGD